MRLIINIFIVLFASTTYSQEVLDVSMSSCNKDVVSEYVKNRLIYKTSLGDTTIFSVGLVQNCGIHPKFDLIESNDTVYFSIKNTSDIRDACDCCFEFTIKALGIKDTNFVLVYSYPDFTIGKEDFIEQTEYEILKIHTNKYVFPSLDEINDSSKTNQWNTDSLKIGIWNIYYDSTSILMRKSFYYVDSEGQERLKWFVNYSVEGEIVGVWTSYRKDGKSIGTYLRREEYLEMIKNDP